MEAVASVTNILIAVFTGITALAVVMTYQHVRHQAGLRRPVRIRRPSELQPPFNWDLDVTPIWMGTKRVVVVHVANRSDVPVSLTIDRRRTRIFGLTTGGSAHIKARRQDFEPHSGGNIYIEVELSGDSRWKTETNDSDDRYRPIHGGWILVQGELSLGKKVRSLCHYRAVEIRS